MSAKKIIQDVCFEFAVDTDELFGRTRTRGTIGLARSEVVRRLKAAGFSVFEMAKALDSDGSTVTYYLYEGRQKAGQRYMTKAVRA